MNNNLTTLLVDANYLIKRSTFGAKDTYAKGGKIGGLYSFIMTLRKLIPELQANKVVLAWDGENSGKMRYYIYEGYKANRESKSWHKQITLTDKQIAKEEREQSDLWQRTRIKQYAEELFIRQMETHEIEGDDIIAYYCKMKKAEENVVIFSNDRDFIQLLDYTNVKIYVDNLKTVIDKGNFFMHFEYHYSNALIMKILCGDTSDNVNGIKGLGEDTLLKHFPEIKERKVSINEVMKRAKELNEERKTNKKGPLKVLEAIANGRELFIRNKKLMDLSYPFMSTQALEDFEELYDPLASDDRGSKNLMPMMEEDGFMEVYLSNFTSLVSPFYPVIMKEKEYYEKYKNSHKKRRNSIL